MKRVWSIIREGPLRASQSLGQSAAVCTSGETSGTREESPESAASGAILDILVPEVQKQMASAAVTCGRAYAIPGRAYE